MASQDTNSLVKEIARCVKVYPKPCVNISGGIDSTIILHHLTEKIDEPIYTYTVGFDEQFTEFHEARRVAEHYNTKHTEILIKNMLPTFKKVLKDFSQPRFNLWPWWLAMQASEDGRETCYIGEGADEHFGGYWYKPHKSYLENWSGFFTYVYPTYKTVYDKWEVGLEVPFHPDNLSWHKTRTFYDSSQEKRHLREAYKDVLPDFVVERKKKNGRFNYWVMYEKEIKQYFPKSNPKCEDDIRQLLNVWVTREWSRAHRETQIVEIP